MNTSNISLTHHDGLDRSPVQPTTPKGGGVKLVRGYSKYHLIYPAHRYGKQLTYFSKTTYRKHSLLSLTELNSSFSTFVEKLEFNSTSKILLPVDDKQWERSSRCFTKVIKKRKVITKMRNRCFATSVTHMNCDINVINVIACRSIRLHRWLTHSVWLVRMFRFRCHGQL